MDMREDPARTLTRRRRRIAALTLVALAILAAALVVALGGGHSPARPAPPAGSGPTLAAKRTAPPAFTDVKPRAPSPGSLPQTHAYPPGAGRRFRGLMAALWAGVAHDSSTLALRAFFPKGAYLQLKAINSAGSDWAGRLVRDFALDLAAAHALLGGDAAHARLLGVSVPSGYGHWVPPGVCDNRVGYYELPNARVLYRAGGSIRSFGIASMISWRGVWYVVHLGAILRSGESGMVDEPASGPGHSEYSGTC
jgi:hypothetical protein